MISNLNIRDIGQTAIYLPCRRMQHPDVLGRLNMDAYSCFNMSNLYKILFEGKDIRIGQGKRLRLAFPCDLPIGSSSPAIAIDEKGVVGVIEQEFAV